MENTTNNWCPWGKVWDEESQQCIKWKKLNTAKLNNIYTGRNPKLAYKTRQMFDKANQYYKNWNEGNYDWYKTQLKHLTTGDLIEGGFIPGVEEDYKDINNNRKIRKVLKAKKKRYKKAYNKAKKIDKYGSNLLSTVPDEYLHWQEDNPDPNWIAKRLPYQVDRTLNSRNILTTPQGYYALKEAHKRGTLPRREWLNYVSNYGKYFNPNFIQFTPKQQREFKKAWMDNATGFTDDVAKLIHGTMGLLSLGSIFTPRPTLSTLSGAFRGSPQSLTNIVGKNLVNRGKNFWDATKKGFNTPIPGTKVLTPNHLATGVFGGIGAMNLGDPESEGAKAERELEKDFTAENTAKYLMSRGIDIANVATAGGGAFLNKLASKIPSLTQKFNLNPFTSSSNVFNNNFLNSGRNFLNTHKNKILPGAILGSSFFLDEEDQNAALFSAAPFLGKRKNLPVLADKNKLDTFYLDILKNPKYKLPNSYYRRMMNILNLNPDRLVPEITRDFLTDTDKYYPSFSGLVYGEPFEDWQSHLAKLHMPNFMSKYYGGREVKILEDLKNFYQPEKEFVPYLQNKARKDLEKAAFIDLSRSNDQVFNRLFLNQLSTEPGLLQSLEFNNYPSFEEFNKKIGPELTKAFEGFGRDFKGTTLFDHYKNFANISPPAKLNQKEMAAMFGYQGSIDRRLNRVLRGLDTGSTPTSMAMKNFLESKVARDIKSAINKQSPIKQDITLLRGDSGDYPVDIIRNGFPMKINMQDLEPGDIMLRNDFVSAAAVPSTFTTVPEPFRPIMGDKSSEIIVPKDNKGLFFPHYPVSRVFSNESEFLTNSDDVQYRVLENYGKSQDPHIRNLLRFDDIPNFRFKLEPRKYKKAKGGYLNKPKNIPMYYDFRDTRINSDNTSLPFRHGGHMYDLFTHGTYDNGGNLKSRPNSIAAKPSWYKQPIVNPSAFIKSYKEGDPRMYKYGFLEGERGNVVIGGGLGFPRKGIHLSGSGVLPLSRYDIPYFKGAYDAKIMKDINKNLSLGLGANTAITGYPGENGFVMHPLKFRPNLNLKYNFRKGGQLIKRADGSYSQRGFWDNIRANKGSGKEPTKEMLKQERKIKRNS